MNPKMKIGLVIAAVTAAVAGAIGAAATVGRDNDGDDGALGQTHVAVVHSAPLESGATR